MTSETAQTTPLPHQLLIRTLPVITYVSGFAFTDYYHRDGKQFTVPIGSQVFEIFYSCDFTRREAVEADVKKSLKENNLTAEVDIINFDNLIALNQFQYSLRVVTAPDQRGAVEKVLLGNYHKATDLGVDPVLKTMTDEAKRQLTERGHTCLSALDHVHLPKVAQIQAFSRS